MSFTSGFIGIMGPPNVGKSTLLNRILGEKLAIVSPKPQTTRNRIMGIYHGEACQMVFVDTPGIHKAQTALHESMVASAKSVSQEVDLVLVMVEAIRPYDPEVASLLNHLRTSKKPAFLVINKIDLAQKEALLPIMDRYGHAYPLRSIIPVSALDGEGVETLLDTLRRELKPGPPFFPTDMKTDQSERFMIGEIVREKIYYLTRRELPYSSAVTVETVEDIPEKGLLSISACIHVETPSQKKIVIGKGGQMVKAIGRSARLDLEKLFGVKVYLELRVRVEKNWSRDPKALRRLGY
ncbi:MAG: GTPase Era [Deltaproteobacteria bacterium]|nr:GTPase Era [Deltaproteobacteria bacterium]MBW1817196.1 GTPase Era [Deltaproteobacteria bacterium]MBW2283488.1 GTPase Era [Deltaproteobacteria bacterium]